MAVPKNKISKQRKHTRRAANWKLLLPGIAECPQCHKPKLAHRACKSCGFYDGKKMLETDEPGKKAASK